MSEVENPRLYAEIEELASIEACYGARESDALVPIFKKDEALGAAAAVPQETFLAYTDFQKAVCEARPDLDFTFDSMPTFQARWAFPGAIFGGCVAWLHGTRILFWGIADIDLNSWIEFERSCNREPRFN